MLMNSWLLDSITRWSGLQVNKKKSNIFCASIPEHMEESMVNVSGFSKGKFPVKYLGLPLISARLNVADCLPILDMMENRLQPWKSRFLSWAGRIVLTKSVLQSLYVYWSGAFAIPLAIFKKMESIMRGFLIS